MSLCDDKHCPCKVRTSQEWPWAISAEHYLPLLPSVDWMQEVWQIVCLHDIQVHHIIYMPREGIFWELGGGIRVKNTLQPIWPHCHTRTRHALERYTTDQICLSGLYGTLSSIQCVWSHTYCFLLRMKWLNARPLVWHLLIPVMNILEGNSSLTSITLMAKSLMSTS